MPIYEYRCENGHLFEVMQRITDDPVTQCETCGAPVQRVFHPIAVHFKGSGFYNTDYGTAKRKRETEKSTSPQNKSRTASADKAPATEKKTTSRARDPKSRTRSATAASANPIIRAITNSNTSPPTSDPGSAAEKPSTL